jgi:hypothetical protein
MPTGTLAPEHCAICGCKLHRTPNTYARPTAEGRSHATKHHYVAERFFGRSSNRPGTLSDGIFKVCPWSHEGESVLLPDDIENFAALVKARGFSESSKPETRGAIAGRVLLLHEIIEAGLKTLIQAEQRPSSEISI